MQAVCFEREAREVPLVVDKPYHSPTGPPDPPSDLDYNDGVVIESSVNLQWTRPSYTGGVDVTNYRVSANGRRLEVMDDSETVSYTTSGLVYGEVQVSAINTCGQESQPATINIPAAGWL